ncbi:MAG: hypothetical protein ACR2F8_11055 [Caulobacteraceae bacterium]
MKILIFEKLELAWPELTLENAFNHTYAEHLFAGVKLMGFPIPGRATPDANDDIEVLAGGLRFPRYGAYCVIGAFGAAKVLLIDPAAGGDERVVAISRFVAQASWHSAADTNLCFEAVERKGEIWRGPFLLTRIVEKLFHSDQPLALHCGHIVDCLAYLLIRDGHACRKVVLRNDKNVGHIFMDVYLTNAEKWVYVDPDFGVMLKHGAQYISSQEVLLLRREGRDGEIEIVDIGNKCFPHPAYNFPVWFSGRFTWRPEMMKAISFALSPYYRSTVIEKGFEGIEFYGFQLSEGSSPSIMTRRLSGVDPFAPPTP